MHQSICARVRSAPASLSVLKAVGTGEKKMLDFFGRNGDQKDISKLTDLYFCPILRPSYATDSYLVLNVEYVSKIIIFGLKTMVKSGVEKMFLKFLHAQSLFGKIQTTNNLLCAWRDFKKKILLIYFHI